MERVQDLDEIGLVGHHRVDVLVRGRDLVEQCAGAVGEPHLALHLRREICGGEQLLRTRAAVATTGAVRARRPGVEAVAVDDDPGRSVRP